LTLRLKCWSVNWDAIARGEKTTEIRSTEDRTFAIGDVLELVRWDPVADAHTGAVPAILGVQITWIDSCAGATNIIGIRLHRGSPTGADGMVVNLAVLSFRLLGTTWGQP
jgi:hypothetical protein